MEKIKSNYKGWMAEQVVKSYLDETSLIDIYHSDAHRDDGYDFLCVTKGNSSKVFAVEIKSSKYTKAELLRVYKDKRLRLSLLNIPIFVFYINYLNKKGYFELVQSPLSNSLIDLNTTNLKQAISDLSFRGSIGAHLDKVR